MSRDYFDYCFDRYDEAEAAAFAQLMSRKNPPVMARCRGCGYRLDSAGHRNACGRAVALERAA